MTSFSCNMQRGRVSDFISERYYRSFVKPHQFLNHRYGALRCCNMRASISILNNKSSNREVESNHLSDIIDKVLSFINWPLRYTLVATDTEFGLSFKRTLTTSALFDCAARWIGFCPKSSVVSKLAPSSSKRLHTANCPAEAARWSGVCFFYENWKLVLSHDKLEFSNVSMSCNHLIAKLLMIWHNSQLICSKTVVNPLILLV